MRQVKLPQHLSKLLCNLAWPILIMISATVGTPLFHALRVEAFVESRDASHIHRVPCCCQELLRSIRLQTTAQVLQGGVLQVSSGRGSRCMCALHHWRSLCALPLGRCTTRSTIRNRPFGAHDAARPSSNLPSHSGKNLIVMMIASWLMFTRSVASHALAYTRTHGLCVSPARCAPRSLAAPRRPSQIKLA